MPDRGGGCRASVCVSLSGIIYGGAPWRRWLLLRATVAPPASFFFSPCSLILLLPPPHVQGELAPLQASFSSSLGLLGTSCCLLGQGPRRCGCLSPLAALPLLSIRSRDWSGDPLAQTDSERATAYSLPHQGNGRAGVQGQGGGDGEDEASETLNPGKVQGLCRSPQGRRGAV